MLGVLDVVVVDFDEECKLIIVQVLFLFGFFVVQVGVVVIVEYYWQVKIVFEVFFIEWDFGDGVQWIFIDKVRIVVFEVVQFEGEISVFEGEVLSVIEVFVKVVEYDYYLGYVDYVVLEFLNGIVFVIEECVDVWMLIQYMEFMYLVVIEEIGRDVIDVYVYQMFVGGGFGW